MNFERLESDVARFKNKGDVLILGDLNAPTSLELDYFSINPSDHYIPFLEDNDADDDNYKCKLPNRRYMDHSGGVKGHGKELIQFCKDSGLKIGNGRLIGDEYGAFTFCNKKALTTIDYILLEGQMFDSVNNFTVSDFTNFSDHAYLQLDSKIDENDNKNGVDIANENEHNEAYSEIDTEILPGIYLNKRTTFKIEGNEMKQSVIKLQNTNEVIDKLNLLDDKIKSGLASVNDCVAELRNILFNI